MGKKETNKEANKSISEKMLIACREALFKIEKQLNDIQFIDGEDISESKKKSDTILNVIERLGKAFETLQVLEKRVQAEDDLKGKARGNVKLGMFEDQ